MNFFLEYRLEKKDEVFFSGWAISSDIYLSGCDVEVQSYQRPDIDPHRNFGFCFSIPKKDIKNVVLHTDHSDMNLSEVKVAPGSTSTKLKIKKNLRIFLSKSKAALIKLIKARFIVHPIKLYDEIKFALNSDNWGTSFLNNTKLINIEDELDEKFILAVPIFNGTSFLENCLESIEKYCPSDFDVYLLDDCSTNTETINIISRYLEKNTSWKYARNSVNLGFLKNCNQIFKTAIKESKNIILLNSDTILYENSLRNLSHAVIQTNGLVCPLTNACSYASFPNPNIESKEPLNIHLIDAINSKKHAKAIRVPVSVGFCLGITIEILKELKSFDPIFGKGYGEEVEMSLRGNKKNIFSYIYTGAYVAHEHGSSFDAHEKEELNKKNSLIINNIYPWFNSLIQSFKSYNLLEREYFLSAIDALINANKKIDVSINHHFGGGASKYLLDQSKLFGRNTLSISYVSDNTVNVTLYMENFGGSLSVNLSETSLSNVINSIYSTDNIGEYRINHLMTMLDYNKYSFHKRFLDISKSQKYLWHDFFAVCPNYTLVNNNTKKFCGVPDSKSKDCTSCWEKGNYSKEFNVINIDEYRLNMFKKYGLKNSQNIFFSNSTKKIVESVKEFKNIQSELIPHKCEIPPQEKIDKINMLKLKKIKKKADKYNTKILLLGGLNQAKGSDIIHDFCEPMLTVGACFIHLGDIENKKTFFKNNYLSYGRYELKNLKNIINELDIDSAFIPSIWPETFNYVADELSMLNIPFSTFGIGAVCERYENDSRVNIIDLEVLEKHKDTYSVVNSIVQHK